MAGQSTGRPAGAPDEQGRRANESSKRLLKDVFNKLQQCGYEAHPSVSAFWRGAPYFVPNYEGEFTNLYGMPMKVDFLVWHPTKHPRRLLLKAKYQASSGSIDEKFPYLVQSLKATGVPALLLVVGGGAKDQALDWLRAQQDASFTVMTQVEAFMDYANKGRL
jgi:hypothetical protein